MGKDNDVVEIPKTYCRNCGWTFDGTFSRCPRCGSNDVVHYTGTRKRE